MPGKVYFTTLLLIVQYAYAVRLQDTCDCLICEWILSLILIPITVPVHPGIQKILNGIQKE